MVENGRPPEEEEDDRGAPGLLSFLARLSGRRRHVRRSCAEGPGADDPHREDEEEEDESRGGSRLAGLLEEEKLENLENQSIGRGRRRTGPDHIRTSASSNSSNNTNCQRCCCLSRRDSLRIPPYLATILILSYSLIGMADACSSRSTPKPRPPPTPSPRPNVTFQMYTCPSGYAEWYCLNGATCFTVKIVDSLLYNCLCSNGYIGQRCEFKDLDGSYLPSRQRVMLETASIAGAVTIAVFLAVITFISVYIHCKRKQKELRMSAGQDAVDSACRDPELRPFCGRNRYLANFMAKSQDGSTVVPPIEKTRMPSWNNYPLETTRMTSVNETPGKRPNL